jgi:hypothetical protein
MSGYNSNNEFFVPLRTLIEKWCDRRCLKALSYVLSPYIAFNGLTDGWSVLYEGLRSVRALAKNELTPEELDEVTNLIVAANSALYQR